MRDIEFRGIPTASKEELELWGIPTKGVFVYGSYDDGFILGPIADSDIDYIAPEFGCRVKKETVEQFTGLKDKHKIKIFEGDLVKYGSDWGNVGTVVYDAKFGYCIEYKIEYRDQIVRTRQEYFADIQWERVDYDYPKFMQAWLHPETIKVVDRDD